MQVLEYKDADGSMQLNKIIIYCGIYDSVLIKYIFKCIPFDFL